MSATQSMPAPVSGLARAQSVDPEMHSPTPLGELLHMIGAGDSSALSEFYDATRGMVFGLALRILGDLADAEETALEVYTQVWKTAASFDPRRSPASAWLVLLTRSRALDRLRSSGHRIRQSEQSLDALFDSRHRRDFQPALAARVLNPEEICSAQQQQRRIHGALCRLLPDQREAIELAFFAGYTHSELAAVLGQPLGTVKTRLRSALHHLRAFLEPNQTAVD